MAMPINYLTHDDLVRMGIAPQQARSIIELRDKLGNITREALESCAIPGALELVEKFIFCPRFVEAVPSTPLTPSGPGQPDAEGEDFCIRSEVGSTPGGDIKIGGEEEEGQAPEAPLYPHDVYPPPKEGRTQKTPPYDRATHPPSEPQHSRINGHRPAPRRAPHKSDPGRTYRGYGPSQDASASDSQEYEGVPRGREENQRYRAPQNRRGHEQEYDAWDRDDYHPLPNKRSCRTGGKASRWDSPDVRRGRRKTRSPSPVRRADTPGTAPYRDRQGTKDLPQHTGYQPLPRSVTFDGTGNWKAFYRKFDAFANARRWSPDERLNQLCWCLERKASDFFELMMYGEPDLKYCEVLYRLTKRFDHQEPAEAAQLEFSTARQHTDESLSDWADRLNELCAHAFPDIPERALHRQMVLRLCQGCLDKEAGCYALDRHPSSMDDAVEAIRWYQHSRRAVYGKTRPPRAMVVHPRDEREPLVCTVDNTPLQYGREDPPKGSPTSNTEGRLSALEDVVQGLDKKLDKLGALEKELDKWAERRTTRSFGAVTSSSTQKNKC